MKKIAAIFLLSIIGIFFFLCSLHAYNCTLSNSTCKHATSGLGSNGFTTYETQDGFEEWSDSFSSELLLIQSFSMSGFHITQTKILPVCGTGYHYLTTPIYLSNHVLLI